MMTVTWDANHPRDVPCVRVYHGDLDERSLVFHIYSSDSGNKADLRQMGCYGFQPDVAAALVDC